MPADPTGPLILVVEDNRANLMLVEAVLRRSGYRIATAPSAEAAVEALRARRPDLVLMDVQLPGEDGLSLTRRLKADPANATLPIVALTARAMPEDRSRIAAAGCDGYLTKPIDTRTFAAQIAAFLPAENSDASSPSPNATRGTT